jgi:site-specific DNA-methyltransferase (adenine-specific)
MHDTIAPYTLHRGDALQVLRTLKDASVDAVITDPPYCSGGQTMAARARPTGEKYVNGDSKTKLPDFEGDFRDQRGFLAWASQWLAECHRVTAVTCWRLSTGACCQR